MSTEAKPFLKWAGGKGQLLSQLDEHLPADLHKQAFTYIEPFVGGGAMLFHMLRKYPNIIIKYGRYIPDQEPHQDEVLGVRLASNNQYAERM